MGMEINCMETIASVHKFFSASERPKHFYATLSTQFRQQQKFKNLFKFVPSDGSIDTRVLVLCSNLQFTVVEALAEISAWPDREELHYELCSCFRQLRKVNFALLS